jgi:hypothetical protein
MNSVKRANSVFTFPHFSSVLISNEGSDISFYRPGNISSDDESVGGTNLPCANCHDKNRENKEAEGRVGMLE